MIEPTSFSMPTERRAIREILGDWRWILLYTRRFWAAIAAYTVLGILSSLTALAASVVTKQLIDYIIARDAAALLPAAGLMVLTSGGSIAFQAVSGRLSARLSLQVSQAIQADVVDRFLSADWLSLQHFRSGDLISRFSSDVASVTASAVSWIPQVVSSAVSFLATFLVILYYDAAMAVIALISAPVLLLASRPLLRRLRAFSVQLRAAEGNRSALLVETFSNADLFKSFGLEALAKDRVAHCQQDYFRIAMDQNRFQVGTKILLSVLGKCTEFLALGYCLLRLWQGGITFGTMTLFLSQRASLSSAFSSLVSLLPSAVSSAVSAHRIREIASLPRETPGDIPQGVRECSIRLHQVQAAYVPGCDVLHHADFHAEPGEIVALVGPSGQGKTSMIRLILGLLPAASGSALLLDQDGRAVPLSGSTRALFSYVPQGNSMLSGTIAENLRMVKPMATDQELMDALRAACAWDFVSHLTYGLETILGERGKGLSEGQAQRLAIARALLRDAPILLLDEATSALDAETEQQVLQNILAFAPRKTCIVTTHRPSVLEHCSRIYRIADGNVELISDAGKAK